MKLRKEDQLGLWQLAGVLGVIVIINSLAVWVNPTLTLMGH